MLLGDLLELMNREGFRHLPVVREGELVGIISDRMRLLPWCSAADRDGLTAADIMTEDLLMIDASMPLDEAALKCRRTRSAA